MGHTLVTRFSSEGYAHIRSLLKEAGIADNNKIPYGRGCDRMAVNDALPYHVTIFHWKKSEDTRFLAALSSFHFQPCSVRLTSAGIMRAEEDSMLLYLNVTPGEGFAGMNRALERAIGRMAPCALHMTLSVDVDHDLIMRQYRALSEVLSPFELTVTGLDLYCIWQPTRYIKTFEASFKTAGQFSSGS